jgi:hypothetical protein
MVKATKPAHVGIKQEAAAEPDKVWTMSVPAAGKKYFGLGKFASYQAADQGLIPYVRVGRFMRALPQQIERKLAGDD